MNKKGKPAALKLPLCGGSGKDLTTRDYCSQSYLTFLPKAISKTWTNDLHNISKFSLFPPKPHSSKYITSYFLSFYFHSSNLAYFFSLNRINYFIHYNFEFQIESLSSQSISITSIESFSSSPSESLFICVFFFLHIQSFKSSSICVLFFF